MPSWLWCWPEYTFKTYEGVTFLWMVASGVFVCDSHKRHGSGEDERSPGYRCRVLVGDGGAAAAILVRWEGQVGVAVGP